MTTSVRPEPASDLAEHWLDTGGIPVLGHDGVKTYPRRSDLRRAEARAAARRASHGRPSAGSRLPSRQRPPAPVSAPRSAEALRRGTLQSRFQQPLAPTPAVLPIPRAHPGRPAGIDVPVPPAPADAFHRPGPQTPSVPLAVNADWGLDLDDAPAGEPTSRRRLGRFQGTATRLLVMALVVGAEGVAVAQFAGPIDTDSSAATAAFALDGVQETASTDTAAADATAAAEAAEAAELRAATLKSVEEGTSAKAQAASQSREAGVEQARKAKAAAAKAKKEAEAKAAKAAAEAKAAAKAKAAAAAAAAAESGSSETSSGTGALSLANSRKNPQAAAKILLTDRGWSSAQYTCLDSLWTRESSWNYQATNPSSGAYGIPQSLPGSKMAAAGSDWKTNPVTQMRWGLDYIADRYGTPCGAWEHSESVGWY
ncbi:aggregation-promoting factor C-terminal-like domain-containing protein [Kineosporia succinea]|uniref:Lytic transglycosylase domain-containing protein n=1 Tax=Kineosporia succinea TaxID=84632 RepID=A0ABT9PCS7_9ACTN|nr:hypothetical protein [Kineosporia succinea]MDP9830516.1 hypothetical protein [Kineosporia succinea]